MTAPDELWFHPLSSYCHKVLVALYEMGTPFTPRLINLGDPADRADVLAAWPLGKIPLLREVATGRMVVESTVIIEHVQRRAIAPGAGAATAATSQLLPGDDAEACEAVRLWDRVMDLHVHAPMQKIVGDRLRPEGERDPRGVADARDALATAYGLLEAQLGAHGGPWLTGERFTLADCAAASALFYATVVAPVGEPARSPRLLAYLERLMARPSVARTLEEAGPYFQYFPYRDLLPARWR